MLECLGWLAAVSIDISNACDEFRLLLMHAVMFISAQLHLQSRYSQVLLSSWLATINCPGVFVPFPNCIINLWCIPYFSPLLRSSAYTSKVILLKHFLDIATCSDKTLLLIHLHLYKNLMVCLLVHCIYFFFIIMT